jgi:hypothetical protein
MIHFLDKILSSFVYCNLQLLQQANNLYRPKSVVFYHNLFKNNLNFILKTFRANIFCSFHKLIMYNYSKTDYY